MRLLVIEHQDDAGPGVFAEGLQGCDVRTWRPDRAPAPDTADLGALDAALVLGAAANVHERDAHPWMDADLRVVGELVRRRVPTLGVCLGAQLLAAAAGGGVRRAAAPEIGWYDVAVEASAHDDPLMGALAPGFTAFQWHSYESVPPADATVLARSPRSLQAFRLAGAPAWGIQFHAEVSTADAASWTEHHEMDPDAVAMGLDPVELQAENEARMPGWNTVGRALFTRFLTTAARHRETA